MSQKVPATILDLSYVSPSGHALQTLDLYFQNPAPHATWLIFIHGGAWRDPLITKSAGTPLLATLFATHPTLNAASINYRLSPHPDHPHLNQTARHPNHVDDVRAALSFLHADYGMEWPRCILAGHSAGAFIAFAVAREAAAVIGVEGIYDLRELVREYPAYAGFVEGAFGEVERWDGARGGVEGGGEVVLVQSSGDELLSWNQTLLWRRALVEGGRRVEVFKAKGGHDEVVAGREFMEVVEGVLARLGVERRG